MREPGSPEDLESFWQECGPIDPDHLEVVLEQLRARVAVFEKGTANLQRLELAAGETNGVKTSQEYFKVYGVVGLAEATFLVDECIAGRLRKARSPRIPTAALTSTHPTAQLVPHLAGVSEGTYVARLDRHANPGLFDERRNLFAITQRMADEAVAESRGARRRQNPDSPQDR